MKCYVQRKDGRYLETVDEFDNWKEGKAMLQETKSNTMIHYGAQNCTTAK